MVDAAQVANALQATLSPESSVRSQAEQYLVSVKQAPQFTVTLLRLTGATDGNPLVRQSASVYFKNMVKNHWNPPEDSENFTLLDADKELIKPHLVELMLSVEERYEKQLSDAIGRIADCDFPDKWPTLMQELVARFGCGDFRIINGVLSTAQSIVGRYNHKYRSDELFREIKGVLEIVQQPLLELLTQSTVVLEQQAGNAQVLTPVLNALTYICQIFHSLSSQDIPEFFEDHLKEFMLLFHKYLTYENPLFAASSDDQELNPVQKLKVQVCEVINLYMERYEEQFNDFMPTFVECIWKLLTQLGMESQNDELVSIAIRFLTAVSKSVRHDLFKNEETLKSVCEKIVVPNLQFRDDDEELFEDNPIEYLRRDVEGSDTGTRRRSACELVKGLRVHFEGPVTQICSQYINAMLADYSTNPNSKWKSKDAAIYLVTALAVTSARQDAGATRVNNLINVVDFYATHIVPELGKPVAQLPVIKADALKFITTFRNQLPKEAYAQAMPMIVQHFTSSSFVVHTYAALAVERMLVVKDNGVIRFGKADLSPFAQQLLVNMFTVVEASVQNKKENEYMMKAVMRVANVLQDAVVPFAQDIVQNVVRLLQMVSANPSNPTFNHYLFETVACLVKNVCSLDASAASNFEALLFPPLQAILAADIPEFLPYVFQILSQLLEMGPPAISDNFGRLLPPLLSPLLWEKNDGGTPPRRWLISGNIPALVRLLQAYIRKGGAAMEPHVQPILGIWQLLNASKAHDHEGFYLLEALVQHVPMDKLGAMLPTIFQMVFQRLQGSRTAKFVRSFVIFLSILIGMHGGQAAISLVDGLQPSTWSVVVTQLWIPMVQKISGKLERKLVAVGMTKLLTETASMHADPYIAHWGPLLESLVALIELPEDTTSSAAEDDDTFTLDEESSGYSAAFVPLSNAARQNPDPFADVKDCRQHCAKSLGALMAAQPGRFAAILQTIDPEAQRILQGYLQQCGVQVA